MALWTKESVKMAYLCKDQNSGPRKSATFFFLLLEHSRGAKIEQRARARWPDLGVDDATYCSGEAREEGLRMERRDRCRSAHLWQPKKNQHATGKRDFVLDSSCNGKALSGEPRTWDGLSVFTLLKTRAPGSKKLIGAGRKPREKAKKIRNAGRWVFFFFFNHVPGVS